MYTKYTIQTRKDRRILTMVKLQMLSGETAAEIWPELGVALKNDCTKRIKRQKNAKQIKIQNHNRI